MPFFKRKPSERDDFIASSFASSSAVLERISAWSGSSERGKLHVMTFHKKWRHAECPTMRWYELQRSSSTHFQSIEHHRNVDGPFFHEFLVLKLADGSACRVERTGDGSCTDAIRRIGCTAKDLIQWLSPADYTSFVTANSSVLLAEIDLGQEFDILDVLAVCYSIQNTESCRVYTVQRYNCYFLCLTVLSVLTRRIANWETAISDDVWDNSVNAALDEVSLLAPDEAKKHILLRICSLLDPSGTRPSAFILDALRHSLTGSAGPLKTLNHALGTTLWESHWKPALEAGLADSVKSAATTALEDEGVCAASLRSAIHDSKTKISEVVPSYNAVEDIAARASVKWFRHAGDYLVKLLSEQRRMIEIEHPASFGARALASLGGSLGGLAMVVLPTSLFLDDDDDDPFLRMMVTSAGHGSLAIVRLVKVLISGFLSDALKADDTFERTFDRIADGAQFQTQLILSSLDVLEAKSMFSPPETLAALHYSLRTDDFIYLLASLCDAVLASSLRDMLLGHAVLHVQTTHPGMESPTVDINTIIEFQNEYIRQRILAHANRVATHKLAAAPLVSEDIDNAMSEVWKSMPIGFGNKVWED